MQSVFVYGLFFSGRFRELLFFLFGYAVTVSTRQRCTMGILLSWTMICTGHSFGCLVMDEFCALINADIICLFQPSHVWYIMLPFSGYAELLILDLQINASM